MVQWLLKSAESQKSKVKSQKSSCRIKTSKTRQHKSQKSKVSTAGHGPCKEKDEFLSRESSPKFPLQENAAGLSLRQTHHCGATLCEFSLVRDCFEVACGRLKVKSVTSFAPEHHCGTTALPAQALRELSLVGACFKEVKSQKRDFCRAEVEDHHTSRFPGVAFSPSQDF